LIELGNQKKYLTTVSWNPGPMRMGDLGIRWAGVEKKRPGSNKEKIMLRCGLSDLGELSLRASCSWQEPGGEELGILLRLKN